MWRDKGPFLFVILSAVLFGMSIPLAKLLVQDIPPVALAGLLYLGAFLGLAIYAVVRRTVTRKAGEAAVLERGDLPYLAGAILAGGILAPISLMLGLTMLSGFSASLLQNLEGVATAVIAVLLFQEHATRRLWFALALMTAAGFLLTWDPEQGGFSYLGVLLVVAAMIGWGIDNNLTQRISGKDPVQIAGLKGAIAGSVSISVALALGEGLGPWSSALPALALGALSYGISLVLFIKALEGLGSSTTGAFFSLAPFVGVLISFLIWPDQVYPLLLLAAVPMAVGVWLLVTERHAHEHRHSRLVHTHVHRTDLHHRHAHPDGPAEPHVHEHVHEAEVHAHVHWPDAHHRHGH